MNNKGKIDKIKGITLISLVITIIILLILAGVTLNLVVGEEGVIKRAINARDVHSSKEALEKIKLAVSSAQIAGLGKVDENALDEDLADYFGTEGYTLEGSRFDGWTVTVPEKKVSYLVEENGGVSSLEYEEPIDNSESLVLGFVDDLGTHATIYLYGNSEKIQEGNITVTLTEYPEGSFTGTKTQTITATDDNSTISHPANYKTFTVSKNGTYTFKVKSGQNESEKKIQVKNIEKLKKVDDLNLAYVNDEKKAYNYDGASIPKGYYVDTKSKINTGLVITDAIDAEGYSLGNEWVWVPVNSDVGNDDFYINESDLMDGTTSSMYSKYSKLYSFVDKTRETYNTFHSNGSNGGILGKPSSSSGYREPAILTDETYGENKYYNSINNRVTQEPCTSVEEVANQYITDYNNMVNSVEKYKGFYIGRYEITANGEKPGTSLSGNWYSLYNKCITLANDNAESSMIYGTLWDATMMWLAKSDYSVGYTQNLTGKLGNYVREEISVRNEDCTIIVKKSGKLARFITGQVSYTMMNNIYDLIGNLSTFTQEALGSDKRVSRGGDYGVSFAHVTYASYRYGDIKTAGANWYGMVSTRPQLYIKVD